MSKTSKSFVPLAMSSSSEEDESKKSSPPSRTEELMTVPPSNDNINVSNKTNSQSGSSCNISPIPTPRFIQQTNNSNNNNHHKAIMMYGQLTPAGRSMTPTCQGRIKAPPVCSAPALQKVASRLSELQVCFTSEEAESCAAKARKLWISDAGHHRSHHPPHGDVQDTEVPLNIDGIGEYWKIHAESAAAAAEVKAYVSSSSTVVTNTSASSSVSVCGGMGRGGFTVAGTAASVASSVAGGGGGGGAGTTTTPIMKKDRPPLEVVRTDNDLVVHSEDEHNPQPVAAAATATAAASTSQLPLSRDFTDKLVKGNSSRQGRSLQRWLVHSQTEELVRQVAGTVPITRDGRIVLVSASRKSEWILPKGGWDADETREECAARETWEEAGLLGRLGACLDPIDYETSKAKKRRLSTMLCEGGGSEVTRPPLPKRVKKVGGSSSSYSPTGPELTEGKSAHGHSPAKANPKNYSYVRLLLFPMYISEVKNDWPEKGRLRKLVDIDEAIKIMEEENRGYFKRGLEMIKERGLHLLKPDPPKNDELLSSERRNDK